MLLSVCVRMGDITVRVWYSWRNYFQSVAQWAILLLECGRLGDTTARVWYSGQYYCKGMVQWAI